MTLAYEIFTQSEIADDTGLLVLLHVASDRDSFGYIVSWQ